MSVWLPMDTAPKDETCILVWLADEGFPTLAIWKANGLPAYGNGPGWLLPAMDIMQDDVDSMHSMTYWMPLPEPPEAA